MKHFRFVRLVVCLCLIWASPVAAQMRLVLNAEVNHNPVRLLFDTGSDVTCLFKNTATRLNLKVSEPDPSIKLDPGEVLMQLTEECDFTLGHTNIRGKLRVYDPPSWIDYGVDGVLAWAPVRDNIFHFCPERKDMGTLVQLPEDIASWSKWKICPAKRLTVHVTESGGDSGSILIDTGAPYGVSLSTELWQRWRNAHSTAPATLAAYFVPASGFVIREECWADTIDIEGFSIGDVPVMQSSPDVELSIENFQAVLGWYALSRLDVIIDGANGHFYAKPIEQRSFPYGHNRLGAVFVPRDMRSEDLVATVLKGTPAWTAGIRNGDILLSIGDLDVTKWRTDPNVLPLRRFWERPAGTSLNLTYTRNGTVYKTAVILREILLPGNRQANHHAETEEN